jgi:hypothetical protein
MDERRTQRQGAEGGDGAEVADEQAAQVGVMPGPATLC